MIYALYIYDRKGTCLYYADWNRTQKPENLAQEKKLMYGMLFSLKAFVEKTSPEDCTGDFNSYSTNAYTLHFYETATGVKFILMTDPETPSMLGKLGELYRDVYIPNVVKNPLYTLHEPVNSLTFAQQTTAFMQAIPYFAR